MHATSYCNQFPATRYQGSKRKLADTIIDELRDLDFTTVLDAFGGTGAVAYAFKLAGKEVTYNDLLRFNHQIGLALIENDSVTLDPDDVAAMSVRHADVTYGDFIERTFEDIYFTTEENRLLDVIVGNVRRIECPYKRALAWFVVAQAAIAKRPYNLFHRRNLYMRTARVSRSFGNKTTWDRSFDDHFKVLAAQANAAVIETHRPCRAICSDILDVEPGVDLVYIDTPYLNRRGVGVDYRDFYHFLEGLLCYDDWSAMVDMNSKHRRLQRSPAPWSSPNQCHDMFRVLFERFGDSILVVSYRSDGIPSIDELAGMLRAVKRDVRVVEKGLYQYALSTSRDTREVLLIGT